MANFMLTTSDNPFNPFTQFNEWKSFDEQMLYFSCQYLGRIAKLSPEMSAIEEEKEIERAIDEIVQLNVLGIYQKAREPSN